MLVRPTPARDSCAPFADPKESKFVCEGCCVVIPLLKTLPTSNFHPSFELAANVEHSFAMNLCVDHHFVQSLLAGRHGALFRWLSAVGIDVIHDDIDNCRLRRLSFCNDPCAHLLDSSEDAAFVVSVPRTGSTTGFGRRWKRCASLVYDMFAVDDQVLRLRLELARAIAPRARELVVDAVDARITPASYVTLADGSHWVPLTTYDEYPIVVTPRGRVRYSVLPKPICTSVQTCLEPIDVEDSAAATTLSKRSRLLNLPARAVRVKLDDKLDDVATNMDRLRVATRTGLCGRPSAFKARANSDMQIFT